MIALAGDTVVVDGEHVEINGRRLERDRIPPEALRGISMQQPSEAHYELNAGRRYKVCYEDSASPTRERVELTVPHRSVFLLGDNRDHSRDSRYFGAIHVGDLIGYVQTIYFPAQDWSRFGAFRD